MDRLLYIFLKKACEKQVNRHLKGIGTRPTWYSMSKNISYAIGLMTQF